MTEPTKSGLVVRSQVEPTDDYRTYRESLRRDFYWSCAYCTIAETESQTINFEIDHYEPKLNAALRNEYSNLMYSCKTCNNLKNDIDPPPEARAAGKRYFRADEDYHSEHFDIDGITLTHKTPVGDFSIMHLDLNRKVLRNLRMVRQRLADCEDLVRSGVLGIVNYRIDRLPAPFRAKALSIMDKMPSLGEALAAQIDDLLREYASSSMADPDNEARLRAKARAEDRVQLQGLYPGIWRTRERR